MIYFAVATCKSHPSFLTPSVTQQRCLCVYSIRWFQFARLKSPSLHPPPSDFFLPLPVGIMFLLQCSLCFTLPVLNTLLNNGYLIHASILQGRGIPRMQALTPAFIGFPATRAFLNTSVFQSNLTPSWRGIISLTLPNSDAILQ